MNLKKKVNIREVGEKREREKAVIKQGQTVHKQRQRQTKKESEKEKKKK